MNPGARQSLLLVDADPQSLRVLDVSLKKAGYDVTTATSGIDALSVLSEQPIDLVISDTHMPEMDGFELCRRIKERQDWARIPFIFLSSRKTIEDKIRGLEIGVEDYLIKPVYIKEITTRVRMLLQRRERERLESRRETRTRFAGELSDIGIVDLVQTIEVNRKSGIVHITNADGRRGAIYFRDGLVIDAEAGRLAGHEAVYRLFAWNDGAFEVEFKNIRRRDVIELSSQTLLMEGMRRLDEWTRLVETLPRLETVFEVDYYVLAERLADIPDEVNTILRLLDGRRSLLQVIDDSDFPDIEAVSIVGRLYADHVIYESQGDKPTHAEPKQAKLGRLERWLSESPWANNERTPPPVTPSAEETTSEDRSTLTGFTASREDEPAEPGRASATNQGMAIVADELPDLKSTPSSRTLHGFAPVRLPSDSQRPAVSSATPVIHDEPFDPDKTPSPEPLGAQPSEEMQLPTATAADSMPQTEAAAAQENEALDDEVDDNQHIDRSEEVTSQTSLDDAARASLLEEADKEAADSDNDSENDDELYDDDEDELQKAVSEAGSHDDVATPEELASLAEILGGQSDDPTPVVASVVPPEAKHEPQDGEEDDEASSLTEEAEEFSHIPSVPGGTALLEPDASQRVSSVSSESLGDPPEPKTRRSGSARKDGIEDSFEDELPKSNNGKRVAIFLMAIAVGGVVTLVVSRSLSTRKAPADPHSAVAANPPTPALVVPEPSAVTAAQSKPTADLPAVELPGPKVVEEAPPKVAEAVPKPEAKQPEVGFDAPEMDPALSIDKCKRAYLSEKYKPIMMSCGKALELNPKEPQIMVMLAHAELDRGHSPAALKWARKAVAADPKIADAYVFIGEVEQELGNKDAAKAAYAKYLDLAPTGKFANDLRLIVKNL